MELPKSLTQLYSEEEVTKAIARMGYMIATHKDDNCVFIMILKGGIYTGMRLLEYFDKDIPYGFIGLNSYLGEGVVSSGHVHCTYKPIFEDDFLRDKNIWIIDDVIQTGATMIQAEKALRQCGPRSVSECVLVDKSESHLSKPDVSGFKYEGGKFIIGCGMGLGERFRSLQCICEYED